MQRALLLLAVLPVFAIAQSVDVEFDQEVDFSKFKTFAINDGQLNSKNPALNNDLVRKQIQAEIRRRLSEKGLEETTRGQNLNVRFSLGSSQKKQVDVYPAGWRGMGRRRVVTNYTEGTLILDLRDTSQKALVWRAIVEEKGDAKHIDSKIGDMVKKPFEQYPPKKK